MNVNLWFLIERSEELPEYWEVHCLELDLISYGETPQQALMMGIEAAYMVLVSDLHAGLNPTQRRAPQEAWDKLYKLISGAFNCAPPGLI